jgi:hypothetical protein
VTRVDGAGEPGTAARATSGSQAADARSAALDAYLERQAEQRFRVETRSGLQAVIVRRHRLHLVLRWLAPGRAEQRLVVSVDQHGEVTSLAAEPVRW